MLLGLLVMQLTASIPDSHPSALKARDLACELSRCDPLHIFWSAAGLHQLPPLQAYTGRQLALQLLPSQLRPQLAPVRPEQPSPQQLPVLLQEQQQPQQLQLQPLQEPLLQSRQQQLHSVQEQRQQQEPQPQQSLPAQEHPLPLQWLQQQQQQKQPPQGQQQQQQQGGQPEWCALTPSAALLSELLPLLTRHCLAQLRQQEAQQRQQLEAISTGQTYVATLNTAPLMGWVLCLRTLLYCSVVPAPGATVPLTGSAADAGNIRRSQLQFTYNCAVPADLQDAYMPYVCDIIGIFEGVLRLAAASQQTAAAAAAEGGVGPCSAAAAGAAAAAAAAAAEASRLLVWLVTALARVCHPGQSGPLLILARAAAQGSQVQRQLYSLLASMAKLGWRGPSNGGLSSKTQSEYGSAAVFVASALLSDATVMQQGQEQRPGAAVQGTGTCGGHAAAVAMLPSVAIVGRCCMQWFKQQAPAQPQQQQQDSPMLDTREEQRPSLQLLNSVAGALALSLTKVQEWLAAHVTGLLLRGMHLKHCCSSCQQ